jgi:hypothetical protein
MHRRYFHDRGVGGGERQSKGKDKIGEKDEPGSRGWIKPGESKESREGSNLRSLIKGDN